MGVEGAPRSVRFLLIYALANAGGVAAFLPLLTLLLPIRIEALAGADRIGWLTVAAIAGAVAASLSNIGFGMLSDRSVARGRSRRRWMAGGLIATIACYVPIALATTPAMLIAAVIVYQVALNALLSPIYATMADEVPDAQKGVVGGMLALAQPIASALSALLLAVAWSSGAWLFAALCVAIAAMVLPLLLNPAMLVASAAPAVHHAHQGRRSLVLAWASRLLVQLSGNVLFYYLLYYFAAVADAPSQHMAPRVAQLVAIAFAVAAPLAVVAGRWSDRSARRKPPILAAAVAMAGGLAMMALAEEWHVGAAGFVLYACGNACFLSLHTALTMEVLPAPRHRGRDLGFINLANTLPAIVGPLVTWSLVSGQDFSTILMLLAIACVIAGAVIVPVKRPRRA